jgi:hypothetical protein
MRASHVMSLDFISVIIIGERTSYETAPVTYIHSLLSKHSAWDRAVKRPPPVSTLERGRQNLTPMQNYQNNCVTNSMELSPWEAATPKLLWNPKVDYHVLRNPSLVPVLRIHATPTSFSKIHLNIILPPMSRST